MTVRIDASQMGFDRIQTQLNGIEPLIDAYKPIADVAGQVGRAHDHAVV